MEEPGYYGCSHSALETVVGDIVLRSASHAPLFSSQQRVARGIGQMARPMAWQRGGERKPATDRRIAGRHNAPANCCRLGALWRAQPPLPAGTKGTVLSPPATEAGERRTAPYSVHKPHSTKSPWMVTMFQCAGAAQLCAEDVVGQQGRAPSRQASANPP